MSQEISLGTLCICTFDDPRGRIRGPQTDCKIIGPSTKQAALVGVTAPASLSGTLARTKDTALHLSFGIEDPARAQLFRRGWAASCAVRAALLSRMVVMRSGVFAGRIVH